MNTVQRRLSRSLAGAGAAVASLGAATPALAAGLDFPLSLPARDIALFAALVLLLVALWTRIARRHNSAGSLPDAPDMRWWRNPQS